MKRKRLFSALMALAMILSLCTFASAGAVTPAPVALAPGSAKLGTTSTNLADDEHLTVSGIGDKEHQTVPAELAEAVISYTVAVVDTPANDTTSPPTAAVHTAIATITSATSASGYTAAYKASNSLDLLTTTAAVIEISDSSGVVAEVTVTPDGQAPLVLAAAHGNSLAGEIKLGKAGEFRPDVAANTDGQLNSYAKDSVSGAVTNEGPLPPDIINVKVPTDAQTKNAFDVYLDPHDLIKDSSAARYSTSGSSVTATGDARLYFKNSATAMSNTSNALKIVNKSSVPVSVDLSLEATKGNSSFTFVNSADAVDTATGPAIYLALKSSTETEAKAVSDTAVGGKNTVTIQTSIDTDESWYELKWHGPKELGYYSYDMKSNLASADDDSFKSLTFNLTGKINDDDAWTPSSGNITFGLGVIWDVKAYVPRPGATVATALTGANTALTLNLDFGESPYNKAKADITINSQKETKDAPTSGHTLSYTYTFTGNAMAYDRLADSATVVFYDSSPTEAGAVTVPLTGIKASS